MKTKKLTLTGTQSLIMCRENLEFDVKVKAWTVNPANKELQVPGDLRSPAWTWMGRLYHDGVKVGIPSDNIMSVLREGGAKVPTGKKGGSFKRQSQSGLVVMTPHLEFRTAEGREILWADLVHLLDELDFETHATTAKKLGFDLFVKRVTIGKSKWVMVRPMMAPGWTATGEIGILDNAITDRVLADILLMAGTQCGIGSWRPSAPKGPGPFGTFSAVVK